MTDIPNDRRQSDVLATILADESYRPTEPNSIAETGLPISLIESLICKRLAVVGTVSGRRLADDICLPYRILEELYQSLRARQILVHRGAAPLNDYSYTLTEQGRERARTAMNSCAYVGPAPVPLIDYVLSAEAQTIRAESPKRAQLRAAFKDITIDENLFENLGPAINSGAGLFLYGEPGNGKSTLAKRITMCFGQQVWIPHAILEDGQIVKLFDAAFHEPSASEASSIIKEAGFDRRWIRIRRPTVVVGGELTMDSLEIRHDPRSNVSEAPLQLKSNCGCLLIDDFGRQRIEPTELLNRWIVPLENRVDFLTLSTGKKIQVPFEQLIIFSTNLEPKDLVDEAFLRRIPYKIEITDPSLQEFHQLFEIYASSIGCDYRPEVVNYLIEQHYLNAGRSWRRCHPRDLLGQIRNYCVYNDLPIEMRDEYFDRVVNSYFTVVLDDKRAANQTASFHPNPTTSTAEEGKSSPVLQPSDHPLPGQLPRDSSGELTSGSHHSETHPGEQLPTRPTPPSSPESLANRRPPVDPTDTAGRPTPPIRPQTQPSEQRFE